jgi:hypothetical protein
MLINFKINEINILVYNTFYRKTILDVCIENGIYIPHFCYNKFLNIAGNCRICLVEITKIIKPIISCLNICIDGLSVYTNSFSVKKYRENVMEFLLINHPLDCPICDQAGECDLQEQTKYFGLSSSRFFFLKKTNSNLFLNMFIKLILNRCILCLRCIRYLDEYNNSRILGVIGRGSFSKISTYIPLNMLFLNSSNIIDLCPVGALTLKLNQFSYRPWEIESLICIDFLDIFGSNVIINKLDLKIIRILPQFDNLFNVEFISDITRFNLKIFEKIYKFQNIMLKSKINSKISKNILEIYEISNFFFTNYIAYKNLIILNFYACKKFINFDIKKNMNFINFLQIQIPLLSFIFSYKNIYILQSNIKYMFKFFHTLLSYNKKFKILKIIKLEDINIFFKTKFEYLKNSIIFQNNFNIQFKNFKFLNKYLSFLKILLTFDDILKISYKNLNSKNLNIINFKNIFYNVINKYNVLKINNFNINLDYLGYSSVLNMFNSIGINLLDSSIFIYNFILTPEIFKFKNVICFKNV